MAALREEVNASNLLAEMNESKQSSLQTALGLMRDETEGAGKTVKERARRGGSNPKPGADRTLPSLDPVNDACPHACPHACRGLPTAAPEIGCITHFVRVLCMPPVAVQSKHGMRRSVPTCVRSS